MVRLGQLYEGILELIALITYTSSPLVQGTPLAVVNVSI